MPPANLVENNSMGTTRAHKPLTGQKVVRKKKHSPTIHVYTYIDVHWKTYIYPRYYLNPVFVTVVTFIDIISSIQMDASYSRAILHPNLGHKHKTCTKKTC